MFMAYLVLGCAILLLVMLMLRAYAAADPAKMQRGVRGFALGSAALGVVLLLFRVPLGIAFLAAGAALPLAVRWTASWPRYGTDGSDAKTSRIDTKYLHMELHHASGTIDGRILAGRHRDRRLAELSLDQLLEVRAECLADDSDGVTLIEAYLDRIHGAEWRTKEAGGQSSNSSASRGGSTTMTREEAYDVLGLAPGVSDAEIREAHHRLMMNLHPDHGGSGYLAAMINQARDVLLGA